MKLRLTVSKGSQVLLDNLYDVKDEESFGAACADACVQLKERARAKTNSVGALYETFDEAVPALLNGVTFSLQAVDP
jgi:hypothetical protein